MVYATHRVIVAGLVLASLSLPLGGCQEAVPPKDRNIPQPSEMTIAADVSASSGMMTSPAFADGAIKRIGEAVLKQPLGTRFRILVIGSRTTDNAASALTITSGYNKRLPAVRKEVEATLRDLFERNRLDGGNASTNIIYTLENSAPACGNGSIVAILSDGVEASEAANLAPALAEGKTVKLPEPNRPYLKGCSVQFIGIGVTPVTQAGSQVQTLPNAPLQTLKGAWLGYFVSTGVKPDDVTFTTIL